jgi:hypothetical protein
MFNKSIPFLALMTLGVITTSCDKNEIEEVATENTAVVQKATSANIIIEETFEGSNPTSTFHGLEFGTSYAYSVVSNPAFDGAKAARIELRDTDPLESGGTRSEMCVIKDPEEGNAKDMWFSFAVYLPASDFAFDSQEEIITQWHQSGGGSPPRNLMVEKDRWRFDVTNNTETKTKYDLGAVAKNVWNQFTFHIIQSNGSDGLVEVWHNGNKVITHKGGNMYNYDNLPKWKVGIYKWEWNGTATTDVSKRVAYYDNIRVGNANATLAEMTAGGSVSVENPTTEEPTTGGTTTDSNPTTDQTLVQTGLTFVNAETEKDVKAVTDGASIDLAALGTQKLSIRADFGQAVVGSAKFALTGTKSHTYTDNAKPYALFGDNGSGNYYYGSYLPVGSYTLTVTPYSGANGTGTAGTPLTVNFTVTNGTSTGTSQTTTTTTTDPAQTNLTDPASTSATGLTFVNAGTDVDYKALTNGATLSLSAMGSPKVSIRADFGQAVVASAKFVLTGAKNYTYIDGAKPYALFGDSGSGNYYYGSLLPVGNYTLTVTPYSGAKGTGTAGAPIKVSFTITK